MTILILMPIHSIIWNKVVYGGTLPYASSVAKEKNQKKIIYIYPHSTQNYPPHSDRLKHQSPSFKLENLY